jgi:heme exporter protein B
MQARNTVQNDVQRAVQNTVQSAPRILKTPFFRAVFAIVRKDLVAELRSRELLSAMVLFALLSILVFSFALELDRVARSEAISGVLWVTVTFASILGLNRSLAMERDQGSLDAMLIAPVDRTTLFYGKLIGNFLFSLTVGVLLVPLIMVLFNVGELDAWLLLVLLLGTLGFAIVGTLLAAMTVQTRSRETMLPIVMLPLALPLILTAVKATSGILSGAESSEWLVWLQLLLVANVIYLGACTVLFDFIVEE